MYSTSESNYKPLISDLRRSVEQLTDRFDQIAPERKEILGELTQFVQDKLKFNHKIRLNFICTHNSRRSHICQVWAQTAAFYFGIPGVECYSGGTEATAFNPRAAKAMQAVGFNIRRTTDGSNPVYEISFADTAPPVPVFSKKYNDPFNPNQDFAAIMTCSHADENCPLVSGAATRIALTYDDPKDYDGTPHEAEKYLERVRQIGSQILYAFSSVSL